MGLTPDQKIDLAIAYVQGCDDILVLAELEDAVAIQIAKVLDKLNKEA